MSYNKIANSTFKTNRHSYNKHDQTRKAEKLQ